MADWEVPFEAVADLAEGMEGVIRRNDAESALRAYFHPDGLYSGAHFETLGARAHGKDEFGCHDLLSLNLLDVRIPGLLIRDILQDTSFAAQLSACLKGMSAEHDLWSDEAPASLEAANELWRLLRNRAQDLRVGMGDTKLSKLLARKRPRLVPISDEIVKTLLSLPRRQDRWTAYRAVFRGRPELVKELSVLRRSAQAEHASLLRIFDVLSWVRP